MWCDSIDAAEYVSFLEVLLNAIAKEGKDGELVFRKRKRNSWLWRLGASSLLSDTRPGTVRRCAHAVSHCNSQAPSLISFAASRKEVLDDGHNGGGSSSSRCHADRRVGKAETCVVLQRRSV